MKEIEFTSAAVRQWRKLTGTARAQIDLKLKTFAETGIGDVKALKGAPGMRLRSGDWRVLFTIKAIRSRFTQSDIAAIFMNERTPWQKLAV